MQRETPRAQGGLGGSRDFLPRSPRAWKAPASAVDYDTALASLYQAPHESFVAERKRLSAELKARGDREAAARLAKLTRPPISAWVVNQLYWREREAFDDLFATAERVQRGERSASAEHRAATLRLRARAAAILAEAGHANNESTLRRVTATLGALAAASSFDPDPPGALSADRDPPGFEAWGIQNEPEASGAEREPAAPENQAVRAKAASEPATASEVEQRREREERAARQRAAAAAEEERKRIAQARAQREAERRRLAAASKEATREIDVASALVNRLRAELAQAQVELENARQRLQQIEAEQAIALAADGDEGAP